MVTMFSLNDGERPENLPVGVARLPYCMEVTRIEDMPPGTVWVIDSDAVTVSDAGFGYIQPSLPEGSYCPDRGDQYITLVRTFGGYVLDSCSELEHPDLERRVRFPRIDFSRYPTCKL